MSFKQSTNAVVHPLSELQMYYFPGLFCYMAPTLTHIQHTTHIHTHTHPHTPHLPHTPSHHITMHYIAFTQPYTIHPPYPTNIQAHLHTLLYRDHFYSTLLMCLYNENIEASVRFKSPAC